MSNETLAEIILDESKIVEVLLFQTYESKLLRRCKQFQSKL